LFGLELLGQLSSVVVAVVVVVPVGSAVVKIAGVVKVVGDRAVPTLITALFKQLEKSLFLSAPKEPGIAAREAGIPAMEERNSKIGLS